MVQRKLNTNYRKSLTTEENEIIDAFLAGLSNPLNDAPLDATDYSAKEVLAPDKLRLRICVKRVQLGYEAKLINFPIAVKKGSKVSFEEAAKVLAKHLSLDWAKFKNVTSLHEYALGRKVYEYEP